MIYLKMKLKWGPIVIGADKGAIVGLWFEGQKYFPTIEEDEIVLNISSLMETQENETVLRDVVLQLKEYEKGERKTFDVNLAPEGTKFREEIWQILKGIPYGQTVTYGEISRVLCEKRGKNSMSAQAVGGAVGHNPISILIPCHRVIGSDGSLTGYAGGMDKKEALLKHEGVC